MESEREREREQKACLKVPFTFLKQVSHKTANQKISKQVIIFFSLLRLHQQHNKKDEDEKDEVNA